MEAFISFHPTNWDKLHFKRISHRCIQLGNVSRQRNKNSRWFPMENFYWHIKWVAGEGEVKHQKRCGHKTVNIVISMLIETADGRSRRKNNINLILKKFFWVSFFRVWSELNFETFLWVYGEWWEDVAKLRLNFWTFVCFHSQHLSKWK